MQLSKNGAVQWRLGPSSERAGAPGAANPLSPKLSGPERDRTADLLNANQALSQLSYRPKKVDVDTVERLSLKERMGGGQNWWAEQELHL